MEKFEMLIKIIKNNIHIIILGILFSILYAGVITSLPLVSKYLIDVILTTNNKGQIYIGIAIFFSVSMLQPIIYYLKESIYISLTEKMSFDLREKMLSKFVNLPLTTFNRINYGEISTRLINDTNEISRYINYIVNNMLTNVVLTILLTVFMFIENYIIASIIFVTFAIYFVLNKIITSKYKVISANALKINEDVCNSIKQNYDNIELTKVYGYKHNASEQVKSKFNNLKKINKKSYRFNSALVGITLGVMAFLLSIIYGIGALLKLQGKITLGGIIAIGLFFQSLVPSLNSLLLNNINLNKVKPSLSRLSGFMDEPEEKGTLKELGHPSIVFENVSFSYVKDVNIFNSLSFSITSPGVYGVLGPSGCGKSTIAKLILGLVLPTKGVLKIFEKNIIEVNKDFLRQKISYLSQESELINDSILNNLLMGNPDANIENIEGILDRLDILNHINSLPDKLDTVITDKINFSGGEKKRIAISRSYLRSANIYIFDEPEASLPKSMNKILMSIYQELSKENIVIVITHHKSTLPDNAEILEIVDGGIK